MSLKYVMDSIESLPEDVQKLYALSDNGKYVLNGVQGVVPKERLDEFRNNNIKLQQKVEALNSLEEELEEARIKLKQKGDVDEETVEKLVKTRLERARAKMAREKQQLEEQLNATQSQLASTVIKSEIVRLIPEVGVESTAVTDVLLRAQNTFRVEKGQPVPYDGKEVVYGDDGVTPLSMKEWLKGLKKTSPHLFKQSQGSGIGHGPGSGGSYIGVDPKKLTPAQKIFAGLEATS
jgi:vacuolar-type H+-ATPase subunit I/STV1